MAKRLTKLQKLKSKQTKPKQPSTKRWMDSFVEYLRSECHLAENSVAAYQRDLRRLDQWLGGRSITKLKISDLSDFVAWLGTQELAPATIARHIVAMKMFFRYLQLHSSR